MYNRNKHNNRKSGKKTYEERLIGSIVPGASSAVNVVDGNLKFALRELKKNVRNVGSQTQLKKKRYFEPKSETVRKVRDYARFLNKKGNKNAS